MSQLFFIIILVILGIRLMKGCMNGPVDLSKKESNHHFIIVPYEEDIFEESIYVFKDLDSHGQYRLFHPPAGCRIEILPKDEQYVCQVGLSGALTMKLESWEKDAQN